MTTPPEQAAPRYWAVVPAAGSGSRMGAERPKQYLPLAGRTVLEHTLTRLAAHPRIHGLVVALAADDRHWSELPPVTDKPLYVVPGGAQRCHSVFNALARLTEVANPHDWVLVHDAARPCLRSEDLDRLIDVLSDDPVGGLLALPISDTVKRADAGDRVVATVQRSGLWRALTPQMFRLADLHAALRAALAQGLEVTDEAAALELTGHSPRLVPGHADNIKITRSEDLELAERLLQTSEDVCA